MGAPNADPLGTSASTAVGSCRIRRASSPTDRRPESLISDEMSMKPCSSSRWRPIVHGGSCESMLRRPRRWSHGFCGVFPEGEHSRFTTQWESSRSRRCVAGSRHVGDNRDSGGTRWREAVEASRLGIWTGRSNGQSHCVDHRAWLGNLRPSSYGRSAEVRDAGGTRRRDAVVASSGHGI